MGTIGQIMHIIVWFLSSEFFLRTRWHRAANGGTVIFYRALVTSLGLYLLACLLAWLSNQELKTSLSWYGAIFAAVYAAFYTRFSSQWTYLAGLYNQIKATEAQVAASANNNKRLAYKVIASWKAGFIEDADDLHLALKPMFAATIKAWAKNKKVQDEFAEHTPGGKSRLDVLRSDVERVLEKHAQNFEQKALTESQESPSMPPSVAS